MNWRYIQRTSSSQYALDCNRKPLKKNVSDLPKQQNNLLSNFKRPTPPPTPINNDDDENKKAAKGK